MQFGAALAKSLFDELGPGGTVFLRVLFAALVLVAVWRPAARGHSPSDWRLIALFGLTLGAMNLAFYESIDRIASRSTNAKGASTPAKMRSSSS